VSVPNHNKQTLNVLAHLTGWGLTPDVQQRIGAFGVLWGVFETNLETTIWALRNEQVTGIRPTTDKLSVSQWIDVLAEGSVMLSADAQSILHTAALAAKDLMVYRHGLAHGWLIPFEKMPLFIRNPSWNGEIRKRPTSDTHIDENLLDMAIDATWILCKVVFATRTACSDMSQLDKVTDLKREVNRAQSEANELRHLSALMNHEKY
jgi:hypothetical protein